MEAASPPMTPARRISRADWMIALALLLAAIAIVALTCPSYGPTYDEPHYASAGVRYAEWWGRAVRGDSTALSRAGIEAAWRLNHEHPPLQKTASGISQALLGHALPGLTAMRLPSALWYGLAVAALFLFLLPVWGRAGALFSALALATLPRFFAHSHFVALDMPIACWFFVTAALTAVALERDSWKWATLAGVAFGLALAAKINGLFLALPLAALGLAWNRKSWRGPSLVVVPLLLAGGLLAQSLAGKLIVAVLLLAALLWVVIRHRRWLGAVLVTAAGFLAAGALLSLAAPRVAPMVAPLLWIPVAVIWDRRWVKVLVAILLVGPAVFFLSWPWLWIAPVAHFQEYLAFHFRHAAYNVYYLRHLYQYAPWHYPFVVTAVTTPALVLLCGLLGLARCWPRRGGDPRRTLLLLGLAVAILPSALPGSPKYNGERLFLPAFPFLCAIAGGAFAWVQGWIARTMEGKRDGARVTALATFALAILLLTPGTRTLVNLHPYQLAYYNELVGGTPGAIMRGFEAIYWGQVFQEGAGLLDDLPQQSPRVLVIPKGVIYLLEFQQKAGNLREDIHFTGDESEAAKVDYVVFQWMESDFTDLCWALVNGARTPVHAVIVTEAPLLTLYDHTAIMAALERLARRHPTPKPTSPARATSDTNSPTR